MFVVIAAQKEETLRNTFLQCTKFHGHLFDELVDAMWTLDEEVPGSILSTSNFGNEIFCHGSGLGDLGKILVL